MKKGINIFISITFYIVLIATVLYLVAGFKYYTLKRDTNQYPQGSLLVIKSNKALKAGNNVYLYLNKEYKITTIESVGKDIINIKHDGSTASIKHNQIIGTIMISIPFIGAIIDFLMTNNGVITLAILVLGYFILMKYLKK